MKEAEEEAGAYPCLVAKDTDIAVYVEKQEVVKMKKESDDEAFLLWGLTFYTFNIKSTHTVQAGNWFLRDKVFGLKTEGTVSKLVENDIDMLMEV